MASWSKADFGPQGQRVKAAPDGGGKIISSATAMELLACVTPTRQAPSGGVHVPAWASCSTPCVRSRGDPRVPPSPEPISRWERPAVLSQAGRWET